MLALWRFLILQHQIRNNKLHSSSDTSPGYGLRLLIPPGRPTHEKRMTRSEVPTTQPFVCLTARRQQWCPLKLFGALLLRPPGVLFFSSRPALFQRAFEAKRRVENAPQSDATAPQLRPVVHCGGFITAIYAKHVCQKWHSASERKTYNACGRYSFERRVFHRAH